jgi:FKBP-type peptidyl-prolyl cis-trans isomerase
MKRLSLAAIGLLLATGTVIAVVQDAPATKPAAPAPTPELTPELKQQAGYCIGLNFGKNLKDQAVEIDVEGLIQGLKDGLSAAKPKLTDEQIEQVMNEFRTVFIAQQEARAKAVATKNTREGAAYCAENAKKPGVKTCESGLQYQSLAEGTGPTPKSTDKVKVHYKGTLLDGTEFDSSYKRGEPATFPLDSVIAGWTEGLQLMKVGGKARLVIPAELAYGENGPPGSPIGPNSTLVFDIELLGIEK